MNFEIKKFNELTVDEMYEIAKSRFEVLFVNKKSRKSRTLMIKIKYAIM